MTAPRGRLDPDVLDPDDPFEIDDGNRPHLFKHAGLSADDLYDVWSSNPRLYPAQEQGEADWLLVARVPGGDCLCVPLAPPSGQDHTRCRPIGIYRAPLALARIFDEESGAR